MNRRISLGLAAVAAGLALVAQAASAADAPVQTTSIVKYVGIKQGSAWGRPAMVLMVRTPLSS